MAKIKLPEKVTRTFCKAGFQLKKHSPEILVVTGCVGVVVSAVMACKATTKATAVIESAKKDIDNVHMLTENPNMTPIEYTKEDSKKDLTIIYAHTALDLVKLYAPAVTIGALSLTGILASNNILRKRNVALATAYATVDSSFKSYRKRVVERFGEELDKELKYDIKAKEIEKTVMDEKGNEKTVKETVKVIDDSAYCGEHVYFYDDGCRGWTKDPLLNKSFLIQQQNWANEKLKAQGFLFLNDVLESLGIPKNKYGQIVGWVYKPEESEYINKDGVKCYRDNYVDFGLYDINKQGVRDFMNGYERTVLLDFNVDGPIIDLF